MRAVCAYAHEVGAPQTSIHRCASSEYGVTIHAITGEFIVAGY
jgi:hypothetical protein